MTIKLGMVNYLNTKPFEYGLQHSGFGKYFEIKLATPAGCVSLLENDKVDISLVPVAVLLDLDPYFIHTDFCIGCQGKVETVAIFSNHPLEECRKIFLDNHSRTSALLTRILVKSYWKIENMSFVSSDVSDLKVIKQEEAVLMIGDKVFQNEGLFAYKYDLGEIWKTYTGLPFVFAAWISKKTIDKSRVDDLNESFGFGVNNIKEVIKEECSRNAQIDLSSYYQNNISYDLDDQKRKALITFLQACRSLLKEEKLEKV